MTAKLYPGIAFSPVAELTDNVGAGDTIIPVSNVEAFPPAPNLATIGTDEEGETVLYAAKTATALSGCTRGVEGTARAWSAGEPIARNWTAKDHGDLITAVEGAAGAAQNTQGALAEHQADAAAHGELFAAKQPKLTGQPGQVVGFGGNGAAQAVPGWSNPNLLDNWYFADPINQRGQTEYTASPTHEYFIDRWITVNVNAKIVDGGILFNRGDNSDGWIDYRFDGDFILGKAFTMSALINDKLYVFSDIFPTEVNASKYSVLSDGILLYVTRAESLPVAGIIFNEANDNDCLVKAVKMELGSQQTLARQDADGNWALNDPPPDKTLELLKCQRYYQRFSLSSHMPIGTSIIDGAKNLQIPFKLNVPMRCAPTVKFDGGMRASGTEVNYITVTPYETVFSDDFSIAVFNFNFGDISGASQFIPITLDAYPYLTIEFDAEL